MEAAVRKIDGNTNNGRLGRDQLSSVLDTDALRRQSCAKARDYGRTCLSNGVKLDATQGRRWGGGQTQGRGGSGMGG